MMISKICSAISMRTVLFRVAGAAATAALAGLAFSAPAFAVDERLRGERSSTWASIAASSTGNGSQRRPDYFTNEPFITSTSIFIAGR